MNEAFKNPILAQIRSHIDEINRMFDKVDCNKLIAKTHKKQKAEAKKKESEAKKHKKVD